MPAKKPKTIPQFETDTCLACGMCADVCPTGALAMKVRKGAMGYRPYPELLLDACRGCRSCQSECPVDAIQMVPAQF